MPDDHTNASSLKRKSCHNYIGIPRNKKSKKPPYLLALLLTPRSIRVQHLASLVVPRQVVGAPHRLATMLATELCGNAFLLSPHFVS